MADDALRESLCNFQFYKGTGWQIRWARALPRLNVGDMETLFDMLIRFSSYLRAVSSNHLLVEASEFTLRNRLFYQEGSEMCLNLLASKR